MGKNACGMGINMILDVIVEDKKKRLVEHKAAVSEEEMKQKALQSTRESVGFAKALKKTVFLLSVSLKRHRQATGQWISRWI